MSDNADPKDIVGRRIWRISDDAAPDTGTQGLPVQGAQKTAAIVGEPVGAGRSGSTSYNFVSAAQAKPQKDASKQDEQVTEPAEQAVLEQPAQEPAPALDTPSEAEAEEGLGEEAAEEAPAEAADEGEAQAEPQAQANEEATVVAETRPAAPAFAPVHPKDEGHQAPQADAAAEAFPTTSTPITDTTKRTSIADRFPAEGPRDPEREAESTLIRRQSLLAPTQTTPANQEEPTWAKREAQASPSTAEASEEELFEGATVRPSTKSRGLAHFGVLIGTILLVPIALALFIAGVAQPEGAQYFALGTNVGRILLVLLGVVGAFLAVLLARWSSLGSFIAGILLFGLGVAGIVISPLVSVWSDNIVRDLTDGSLASRFVSTFALLSANGTLAMAGAVLLAVGFVSHGARRKGREDTRTRERVEDALENRKKASRAK
ncbi:MFS transporter [Winkia sp. ACRQY]|uniref:Uncharacterized protein n=1 Tax=Winkia neuii BV029A5 TaxID=888439 RepID=K0YP07_9ACTO|nr:MULTISPECIES: MFS transporter [Winkia]EJZ85191.1 hypothetical protein HMPREF9240_01678 [Winkia neuii BV029A5]MCG7302724.1 MFS transporter [Winkia sp. ACRQY]MDK7905910.1 MFS transporter [Winkia sp. UMB0889B]MDK8225198.1 MFS transporter [Winkia sp. UMB750B]MDK8256652.1 MFS transporter [Winkia sp. UMB750A]